MVTEGEGIMAEEEELREEEEAEEAEKEEEGEVVKEEVAEKVAEEALSEEEVAGIQMLMHLLIMDTLHQKLENTEQLDSELDMESELELTIKDMPLISLIIDINYINIFIKIFYPLFLLINEVKPQFKLNLIKFFKF